MAERHHDAERAPQAGNVVGQGSRPRHDRGTSRLACKIRQTTERVRDPGKAGPVAVRPVLPVGADAKHRELRIDGAERIEAEAPFLERSGAEIFKHDVRLPHKLPEQRCAPLRPQIQRDRFLVARFAQPDKRIAAFGLRAEATQRISRSRLLDLDDLGTEIGEHRPAERRSANVAIPDSGTSCVIVASPSRRDGVYRRQRIRSLPLSDGTRANAPRCRRAARSTPWVDLRANRAPAPVHRRGPDER